jgi:hypothetical protein
MTRRPLQQVGALLLVGLAGAAFAGSPGCVPKQEAAPLPAAAGADQQKQPAVVFDWPKPEPPPPNPQPPNPQTGNVYTDRFLELWTDLHNLQNGYYSPEGIPYHAIETLVVEAPDYGHLTTSEAYSYWIWLEAMYGKVTGDFSWLKRAWASMEYYIIPQTKDQPTNQYYQSNKPATFAPEAKTPQQYPVKLDGSVQIGTDPLSKELRDTYQTPDVYAMHWLLDVDNFYGYGNRGDGTSRASYINTFQRGMEESVWETVPHPSWEEFKWGGQRGGFLDIFLTQPSYARQWRYSNAPDADARAIQAVYWAKVWAEEQGGAAELGELLPKARMMGDFVRYAFFDKYFKRLGCQSPGCEAGTGRDSAAYLINWYFAWGGSIPVGNAPGWAWRIGASFNHQGYQNLMCAYALSQIDALKPASPTGAQDWAASLQRQLEYYRWLQSADGPIAGGAPNSWAGAYEPFPQGLPTFYGMAYDWTPVFHDPPSNDWFGFQVWSMQRVAEYFYVTGDPKAQGILDRWVKWVMAHTTLKPGGDYETPAALKWSGNPSQNWDANSQNWDYTDRSFNANLRAEMVAKGPDVGVTAGLVHTLLFYAKKSKKDDVRALAKQLLDRMWNKYREKGKGVVTPEVREDYKRFGDAVYVPPGWVGKMANGDPIDDQATFLSIRSKYKQDPAWPQVEAYLKGGNPPEFRYHRFWAQAHIALAYAAYGWLFPEDVK